MHAALRRLRSDDRWWAADIATRGIGTLLLGVCAASACWLYRSIHRPPAHAANVLEFAAAALAVLCWTSGWATVAEGQKLFRLVKATGHYTHLDSVNEGIPL